MSNVNVLRVESKFGTSFVIVKPSEGRSTLNIHVPIAESLLKGGPGFKGSDLTFWGPSNVQGHSAFLVKDNENRWVTAVDGELEELTSCVCTIKDDYSFLVATDDELKEALKSALNK